MAMVMVSQGVYYSYLNPSGHVRTSQDLSFSRFISNLQPLKGDALSSKFLHMTNFLRAEVGQQESGKLGTNGRASKMVSTKELMKTKFAITQEIGLVNGRANASTFLNGSKRVENGVGLVKRSDILDVAKTPKKKVADDLSSVDKLKVLPSHEGFSWANENYNAQQRTFDIWFFFLSLHIRVLFDNANWAYLDGFTEHKQKKRRERTASWCRERVLQLGPTFIKLGQLLSTRSDLFPKEFVDELAQLQDRVPAFSPENAKAFIENELGLPVNVLFRNFEDQPIAAASLGQVHRAILHNGENVVIKVQRPGLKRLFDIDLRNLKLIAEYFQQSETFGGFSKDWIGIYDECSKILYQEIDYINEARNADRFRRDFRNVKWVHIPAVLWDYTSTKVLTLEYVPGFPRFLTFFVWVMRNLIEVEALKPTGDLSSVKRSIQYFLDNLLSQSPDQQQTLAKIGEDLFAIATDQPLRLPSTLTFVMKAFSTIEGANARINNSNIDIRMRDEPVMKLVMRNLIEVEALKPTGDTSSVKRSIQFFLDNLLSQSPDKQQTLAKIGEDLFAIATDQPLRLPSTLTFVMKAFSTIEGIGYTLDPEFSFIKAAAPYANELLFIQQKQQTGAELVNEIRRQANDVCRNSF
ncbi:protein ACTIVITY OF BC1 COMPLEX KINASE 7, chloroplastic [Dendrobium catenatum]|uniref:protein ACTIVITY OF BC1 COMPLEX KINASE 7, chloroplastic n=1 Tax=Dendrobium catenatum TaxID=906689 RepID=UPI00109F5C7E|nr:protein ACTIVITY OF BC1 COMPLEX KINASE 7, chloroplastic [Dendrobium catenatum]